jgi:hypothetical protein
MVFLRALYLTDKAMNDAVEDFESHVEVAVSKSSWVHAKTTTLTGRVVDALGVAVLLLEPGDWPKGAPDVYAAKRITDPPALDKITYDALQWGPKASP